MSDTDLKDERPNLLAVFGGDPGAGNDNGNQVVERREMRQVGRRIVGAQIVAVKRDLRRVLADIKVLAEAAGEAWYYRWPVNEKQKDGTTKIKWIEGPTIKCANVIARSYGNCDLGIEEVEDHGRYWVMYARFVDIETGASLSRPFRQRQGQTGIKTDSERSLDIAFQIGVSKAERNVVTNILEDITAYALEAAKDSQIARIEARLDRYKERLVERMADENVDLKRVEAVIGKQLTAMNARDLAKISAIVTSVNEGMASFEDVFPPLGQPIKGGDAAAETGADAVAEVGARSTTAGEAATFAEGQRQEDKAAAQAADVKAAAAAGGEKVDSKTGEVADRPAAAPADPAAGEPAGEGDTTVDRAAIHKAGAEAKAAGKSRAGMPKAYREAGRETEASAWLDGFAGRPLAEEG